MGEHMHPWFFYRFLSVLFSASGLWSNRCICSKFVAVSKSPQRAIVGRFCGEMDDHLKLFVQETSFYNNIVLRFLLPESWWISLPHFLQGWLRNYLAGTLLYFISGLLWCFYIYYLKRNVYLPKGMYVCILIDDFSY